MTTPRRFRHFATMGFLAIGLPTIAPAQVVERDVTITGPRGNSVERQIRTERVGNVIDRQVTIRRPGGTFQRETEIIAPRGRGPGPGYGYGYGYGPRPGPAFYGGPRFFGPPVVAGPAFGLFFGVPMPPLVIAPPPIVIAPQPRPVVVAPDAVATELSSLGSIHSNHRRDAAIALGKYGDPRAVPPLIDRLKNDHEKDVRQAAAWALAEIGDSRAVVPLEVAAQFDKKPDVRAVAAKSLARMPTESPASSSTVKSVPFDRPTTARTLTSRPAVEDRAVEPSSSDDVPPPDPTPALRSPR